MRNLITAAFAVTMGVVSGLAVLRVTNADAQTASTASALQAEVLVLATATEMPRTKARTAFEVFNNGPANIFCAPTSAGAVVNKARPVAAGSSWTMDAKDSVRIWCIAVAPQVTGAATIFTELR